MVSPSFHVKSLRRNLGIHLRRGMHPRRAAWTLALGVTFSVFPFVLVPTLLCGVAAWRMKLNHGLIQAVNLAASPLQWLLAVPFAVAGWFLLGRPPIPVVPSELAQALQAGPEAMFAVPGQLLLAAVLGWLAAAPVLFCAVLAAARIARRRRPAAALVLAALLLHVQPAAGADGLFEQVRQVEGVELHRTGRGQLEVLGFLDVYAAALYAGTPAPCGSIPLRLETVLHVPVQARYLVKYTRPVLEDNLDPDQLSDMDAFLDQVGAAWRDGARGDRFALTFLPGRGLRIEFNGSETAMIAGDRYAQLYFSIWLGSHPVSRSLKQQLGRENPVSYQRILGRLRDLNGPAGAARS